MKYITVVFALLLLVSTASASTFQISNVGSVMPFSGGTTNVYYNSGSGTVAGLYADQTYAYGAVSSPGFSAQTRFHNPHTVRYDGTSYNTAHRTLQPQGWQMQTSQVRSDNLNMHVAQGRYGYYGTARIGNPPTPVAPMMYRQPHGFTNPWGAYSNYNAHHHYRTPTTTAVRPTNYW